MTSQFVLCSLFFFSDTPTTEIYTLSLHDALPISSQTTVATHGVFGYVTVPMAIWLYGVRGEHAVRSEEHTSELQSHSDIVCRLLLEKKNPVKKEHIAYVPTKA